MSNPVQEYVSKYRPPQQPSNPVDEYLKRYGGQQQAAPSPVAHPAEADTSEDGDGYLMTGLKFIRSVMKASAHLPIDVAKGVGDLVYTTALAGGTSPENEASRAASRRFGTGRENYTPPEQQVKPEGELSAGQQAVDFVNIPKMVMHSYEEFQNAKTIDDAAKSAVGVAFGILGGYGLARVGYTKLRGKPATPPPDVPPPAGEPATPEPTAPVPTGAEIVAKAESDRAAAKASAAEKQSIAAKRRIAWTKMTPEQRALVTPELPATEHGKAWKDLSPESKAIIKDAWAEKPRAADPNLDESGTAGEAGTPIPEVDPSVIAEIGPEWEVETPLGPPVRKNGHQLIIDEINRLRALDGLPPLEKAPGNPKVLDLAAKLAERAAASKAGETAEPKIPIPPVEDLSRGTWDGVERRSRDRSAMSPEELLKAARQRGVLTDKTTSGGTLDQPAPPRTPEAEAVMAGKADPLDQALAEMKNKRSDAKAEVDNIVAAMPDEIPPELRPLWVPDPVVDGGIFRRDADGQYTRVAPNGREGQRFTYEQLKEIANKLASGEMKISEVPTPDAPEVTSPVVGTIEPSAVKKTRAAQEEVTAQHEELRRADEGPQVDMEGAILDKLEQNGDHPMTASQIAVQWPTDKIPHYTEVQTVLDRMVSAGRLVKDGNGYKRVKLAIEPSGKMLYPDDGLNTPAPEQMPAPRPDAPKAPPPAGDLIAPKESAASPAETAPTAVQPDPAASPVRGIWRAHSELTLEQAKAKLAEVSNTPTPTNEAKSLQKRIEQLDPSAKKPKAAKPKKELTPAQLLDKAETANDRALDKNQITEEQWGAEVERIATERLRLKREAKAAETPLPKATEAVPVEQTLDVPDPSNQRVTVKAKSVEQGLDPKTFPSRMRDNLKTVSAAELEQRLVELEGRKAMVTGDKEAVATYQKRINQIHEVQADRAKPKGALGLDEKGYLRVGPRKVLNDKTPEQMSPAERTIAESVITEPDLTQPLGLTETLRKKWAQVVDSELGFKSAANRIFGKGSPDAIKAQMRAEVGSGSLTRAEEYIRGEGTMLPTEDGNWVKTGNRSVHDIINSIGGQSQVGTLGRVWASLNTIELYGKGKIAGPDVIAAQKFVKEVDPKFIAASLELRKIGLDLAKYAEWGGLITKDTVAKFAQQAFYAPIKRLLAHEGEGRTVGTRGGKDLVSPSGQPIKRLKGSRKAQLNPVETLIDNVYRTIRAAEQNRRVMDLVKGASENPEAARGILEPASHTDFVKAQKNLEAKADAAVAAAKEQGVPLNKAEALDQLKMTGDENLNITDNILHVWVDGKPALWRVSDELAYSIKHMQVEEFKLFTRVIGAPAALVHAGVVADPFFLARQLVLDNMQAFINTQYGFNPFALDQLRGWMQLIRNTPVAQEYRMAGGGFSGLTSSRFRSAKTSLADAVRPKTSGPVGEAIQQLKEIRPVDAWKTLVAPFEEAARVGEYMRARGAGASMLEAIYAAKRVTTNFQRSGGEMQAAAHTIPFLNAGIQGLAQAAENFSRRPKQWTARAAIAAAVPAFTLWWMNKDDEEIQQLRRTEGGSRYFFFRSPEGTILKMRKPYLEGAIFANGIEAALDASQEQNPQAFKEWGQAIAREASFNAITTLGYVPLSLWANKDFRTGLPIVPERMADVDPAYQAGPYTGAAARVIGEAVGVSPAQVEYTVRGTLGGVGALAMKAVDAAVDYNRTGELPKPADIPGMSSFIAKYPSQSVRPMQEFYRESERLAKISNTIDYLSKTRPEALAGYLTEHKNDLALLKLYAQSREKVGANQRVINELRSMPPEYITQREKDDLINNLILNMIQQAKITNQIAGDITGTKP